MKRLFLPLFLALFAVSCTTDMTKDVECLPIGENQIFVSFEEQSDTRIQLNEECKTVWTKGDLISVFEKNRANACWRYIGATGKRNGAFIPKSSASSTQSLDKVVVVYPYNESYTISVDKRIVTTLPAEQLYHTGSYSVGDNLMVSQSDDRNFVLKSVCGWLKFQFVGTGVITKIEFSGNNYEQIAGKVRVDCTDASLDLIEDMLENPTTDDGEVGGTLIDPEDYVTTVALNCGEEGVALNTDTVTDFYLILPPQTFESGITVKVTCADGTVVEKSTKSPLTISRNAIQPMTALTINGKPATPASNEIWYTATEKVVKDNWTVYTFGANITDHTFDTTTGKGIITFDGEVTKIGGAAFYECSNITSVTMPESVTTLGINAFSECTGMQELILPHSITKIGGTYDAGAFRNCTGKLTINCNINDSYCDPSDDEYNIFYSADFTEIIVGDSVTTIGKNAFRTCSELVSLTLGNNIQTFGSYAFYGCSKLTKIYGSKASADNRCWIDNGVLYLFAYSGLTSYNIPANVTAIGPYAFYNCSSLQDVIIPENVASIGSYAFYNCSSLQNIYVKASTPSTLANYVFSNNADNLQCYIPFASAEAYNVANGWKDLTLVPYDYENGKVYEPKQDAITYDWYTTVTDGIYTIDAPEELVALSKLTNGDAEALAAVGVESAVTFEGMTINLAADIDLSDYCSVLAGNWTPIGTFKGVFNGNNHTISNLYSKTTGGAGLFLSVSGATIKDVTIHGTLISREARYVGGIASEASSTLFENCISAVNITTSTTGSFTCVGGVVGYSSNSKYIACQSTGNISDTIDEWEWANYVGGIVGNTNNGGDKFIACMKLSGKVYEEKSQSYSPVGGILGCVHNYSNVSIRSCYTSISILGREPGHITNMGYYENYNPSADIANCYYSGTPTTSKGIGTRNYGGQHKSFDYGTARSTDIAAEIVIMNEGIDSWNAANTECICNYKYALDENSKPKLVKQAAN